MVRRLLVQGKIESGENWFWTCWIVMEIECEEKHSEDRDLPLDILPYVASDG